jgi:multidrug resistance efflux pump
MAQSNRIPIPWSHRWRWVRIQAVPLLIFAVCAIGALRLWKSQGGAAHAVGEVYALRVELISRLDGLLTDVPYRHLQLFERVHAGDIVLRLDDQTVRATLETLGKSLDEAKAQLGKSEEQVRIDEAARKLDRLSEARRRAVRVEQVRLALLTTRTILETDKVELQRLNELATILREAFERGAINRVDYINAQLRRDLVAQRIASNEKVLVESQEQLTRATELMSQFSPDQTIEVAKLLSPVRAAIEVQESRTRELELQVKALEIRSPIDGTVVAIVRWPGQAVRAGDPIATIAAEQAQYIVGYIRQQQRFQPTVGGAVDIRLRSNPTEAIAGFVDRVGPQVESVPAHQLRDPRVSEWGLPVRVVLEGQRELRPGELVDLKFRTDSEPPPPGGRRATPAEPGVPPRTPGT